MQSLADAVLESWDRQSQIIANLLEKVPPELMDAKAGEDEWTLQQHFGHIQRVRRNFLGMIADPQADESQTWADARDERAFSGDPAQILPALAESAQQVRDLVEAGIANPTPVGPYSHPIFFLQHMVWHEGWHASSIMHTLRANGHEPDEEWEEAKIWAIWRS